MTEFRVGVQRAFVAYHYLVGGDFGAEGERHSHRYRVEAVVEGPELGPHGFLVDIVRLKEELDRLVDRYRDRTLNELAEFEGLNPSCESFARVMAEALARGLEGEEGLSGVSVTMWESDDAWASCRLELG